MLAGQLLSIARDFLYDYSELKVIETLNDAFSLASDRPSLSQEQYAGRLSKLKQAADRMLNGSIVKSYPIDLKRRLAQSNFSQALPESIARMLLVGFNSHRKAAAMSSAEIKIYLDEAQAFKRQMDNIVNASEAFGVEVYNAPDDTASVEVRIPDRVYGRELGELPSKIERLEAFFSVIEELVTGSRGPHRILWISTTDLVLSIPLILSVAGGVLFAYTQILTVVEKQLNVLKLIRDLRNTSGGEQPDIEETVKQTVSAALADAVEDIVKKLSADREPSRRNELTIELRSASEPMLLDIGRGLRLSYDPRYQHKLASVVNENEDGDEIDDDETEAKRLEDRQEKEMRITDAFRSLDDEVVKLLTEGLPADGG